MATNRYADLAFKPVELTAQEVLDNLPAEDKLDYQPAQMQTVTRDQPIMLFHKPANDNQKPEEQETQPDQAETARRNFEERLSPALKMQVAANRSKKQPRPNRTKLKTIHTPKPAHPAIKPVSSEPLNEMMRFYQEQQPEAEIVPFMPHTQKHRGTLKLLHTAESVIEDRPLPEITLTALKLLKRALELQFAA